MLRFKQIKMNGYIVFESVLSQDLVDELRVHYMELLNENIAQTNLTVGQTVADAPTVPRTV